MDRLPESCNRNGVAIPRTGVLNQPKHVAVPEPSNRPNFHGDKATIARGRNGADSLAAPTRLSPQSFSKEEPQSLRMDDGINATEARNSGTLNSSIEVAKTASTNTETTNTEYKFQWKKMSRCARKRYHMLKEEGIPMEDARKLCRINRTNLEHMLLLNPQKRTNPEAPQGPPNKTPKTSTEIDKQSLSSNDVEPLRVGITNSQSMSEDQMRMLRQHLTRAIIEKCSDGSGPEFLGFSHKAGWVLVTCGNQRSKDWLVHEVPYQEPWPGAQLSIIPDQELPKPPRAVTSIPDSEGVSVEEALKLFKVQNSGLNTELWKVRCEKVEKEGKTVYFTIDDPSADALRAQNCQAFLRVETVTFKINGQYRVYTPWSTQNPVPATQGGSSKPLPQSVGGKSSDQSKEATVTNKVLPSLAARCQWPQAAGRDQVQPIQHQDFQPPAKKTPFAQGRGEITGWKKPAALAVGQSNSQNRGETRSITQNSQGHGNTPLIQPSLGRSVIRESSFSAKGLPPQATNRAAIQNNTIQESKSGRTPTMGRFESAGQTAFDVDGSALANRGRSSQRVFPSHAGSFDRKRTNGTIDLDKSSQATTEGTYHAKNTYSSHLGAFALNKGVTARELTPGGFGARPIIQNSLSGRTPFTQSREGLTESDQDGFSALARGKLSRVGDPPSVRRTLVKNGMEAATVSNQDGFLGQSQAMSGFGGRQIIRDSQLGRTISQYRSGETDRTSDQDSALKTNQAPRSQVGAQIIQDPSHGNQGRKLTKIDLTVTDSDEDSPEAEGGYHSWVIEDLESYTTRITQGNPNGALTSATEMSPPATYRDQSYATQFAQGNTSTNRHMTTVNGLSPQGRDSIEVRIIGSESHGRPVYGCRTMTGQSRPERLWPHPSGSSSFGLNIEPKSHGRPFSGSRTMTDRDLRPGGLSPYPSGSFGSRTIQPESYGRPLKDSGALTDLESMPEGLLPHPNGFEIEPESRGRPFQDSGVMVTDRGSMSNRRLSPQGRGSSGGRGRLQGSEASLTDRDFRTDGRLSPHAIGSYGGRRNLEPHGRFQGSKGTLTDRDSRTDRSLSPLARGSYGGRQNLEPQGRFQDSKGTMTDRDSRSERRLSPLARGSYGGRQDLDAHGRFQVSRGSLTDRDFRSDRRLSPLARGSYGGRQDLEPHERFQGSKGTLTDRDSKSDRRLSPSARGRYGSQIQDPEPHGRLQVSRGSLTDRDSRSDRRLTPSARGRYGSQIQDPELDGRLQIIRGSLTDRDSRSDRRLSPLARGSYGGHQDLEPHERFQGSKGTLTDRDSKSDRRLSPSARGRYGSQIQDPEPHGRPVAVKSVSRGSLTDRDFRSDRRLSSLTRGSYGGSQDSDSHERLQGSKESLTDRDLRSNRRLSPHAVNYGGRQDPETPFHSKRSLTDRGSRSDSLSPHAKGYGTWTIEEPESGRGMSWDGSTAIPRERDEFRTREQQCQEYLD